MVKAGQSAPDFTARTTRDEEFTLSQKRGRVVVLFFFPRAFTPGCTREAKRFGKEWKQFQEMGAEIIGISNDDQKTQCDFAKSLELPFPLIADADGKICALYGVTIPLLGRVRRVTFVVSPHGVVL